MGEKERLGVVEGEGGGGWQGGETAVGKKG